MGTRQKLCVDVRSRGATTMTSTCPVYCPAHLVIADDCASINRPKKKRESLFERKREKESCFLTAKYIPGFSFIIFFPKIIAHEIHQFRGKLFIPFLAFPLAYPLALYKDYAQNICLTYCPTSL